MNAETVAIDRLGLLAPGRPGQHQGVSHCAKHWLNPGQYWNDIAPSQVVPVDAHRPAAAAARVVAAGDPTPHKIKPVDPSTAIRDLWDDLADVQRYGYDAVIGAAFSGRGDLFGQTLSATEETSRQGYRLPSDRSGAPGRVAALLPAGIIVIGDAVSSPVPQGASESEGFLLRIRTAYRPVLYRGARFGQGADDEANRKIRRGISESKAKRSLMTLLSHRGANP